MKFTADVYDTEVPALLESVFNITEPWLKRFAWLSNALRQSGKVEILQSHLLCPDMQPFSAA